VAAVIAGAVFGTWQALDGNDPSGPRRVVMSAPPPRPPPPQPSPPPAPAPVLTSAPKPPPPLPSPALVAEVIDDAPDLELPAEKSKRSPKPRAKPALA